MERPVVGDGSGSGRLDGRAGWRAGGWAIEQLERAPVAAHISSGPCVTFFFFKLVQSWFKGRCWCEKTSWDVGDLELVNWRAPCPVRPTSSPPDLLLRLQRLCVEQARVPDEAALREGAIACWAHRRHQGGHQDQQRQPQRAAFRRRGEGDQGRSGCSAGQGHRGSRPGDPRGRVGGTAGGPLRRPRQGPGRRRRCQPPRRACLPRSEASPWRRRGSRTCEPSSAMSLARASYS